MRFKIFWTVIGLIISLSSISYGQSGYAFQNLTKKDGLSQSSVFAIAQDNSGFMWFGTRDGLNKYDGYQFKVYQNENTSNSLISNDIRTLYFEESKKELWIGSHSGLSKYQSSTDDFVNFVSDPQNPKSISNNIIRQIYRDSKGRLWVGTSIGLNLLDESNKEFKRYYFENSTALANKKNDIKAILEDRFGDLWFGTVDGLFKLKTDDNGSFYFEKVNEEISKQLSDSHIKCLLEDEVGNLWIGTFEGGLNYWNRKEGTIIQYQNDESNSKSLSHNNIRSLCFDQEENLWVATFDGLNFWNNGQDEFQRFTKSKVGSSGLSDKSIRSLFVDKRGSLWVGTYYGGINHLDENYNRFNNHKHSPIANSLRASVVSSFAEDLDGNLWIGTEGDGLSYYDKANNLIENFRFNSRNKNSLSGNNVKQLLLDEQYLWIGTFQAGLNRYNTKTKEFKQYKNEPNNKNSISANNVYDLYKETQKLWILTYGGGLDILDVKQNKFYNYINNPEDKNSLSSDLMRVFLKTQNGQIWIGTERGLNKVTKDQNGLPESFEVYLLNEKIYCLTEDSNGFIWIGTFSNGFYRLDPSKNVLEHFTTKEGLPGNTVLGILEVDSDELWVSTNNGLSKFDPNQKTFTNYDYSNGLENSEYNFNAYYKDKEGHLLFGGLNGFTYFNPAAIQPNEDTPSIVFTELRKNNQLVKVGDESGLLQKSINETEEITFDYNEANFSISFAALDYFSPGSNQYAYMLSGIDKEWNYSKGKTEATYTIQRSGEYIFKLKGANSEGIWNPEEKILKINVSSSPWYSWWAYLIYVILLGAFAFGLFRYIKLRHNLQLEKIINQQQGELHEVKLRFFTNITHEFRTPLTLILAPLNDLLKKESLTGPIRDQLKTVERNGQRMLNLVNQILTFRKLATDHTELNLVKGDIVGFLNEIFLLFKELANRKNINYVFDASDEVIEAWFDQDKLEKIFFNLLSNAFKFTPKNENIIMSVVQQEKFIEIKVSDSGVGVSSEFKDQIFKRFYEKSNTLHSNIKGSGIGLAISKQMVELHHGHIFLADKSDSIFQGGATFVVNILKGNKHFGGLAFDEKKSNVELISNYNPVVTTFEQLGSKDLDAPFSNDSFKILIVEDNPEIQAYINKIFSDQYIVITANNGVEGLAKAKKHLPDLVISDIMMPEKDGVTFCKELKTDFEISHIPIVLLTARTTAMFKIEGLEVGADDYITKPFHPDELRLRVRNIITAREALKSKFKRVVSFEPQEVNITSADEIFLEKAMKILENEIGNNGYSVNQFAYDLAVSRPLLFTKLKALTGQTPNNFIKSVRLKRAAQLLETERLNISEIAYSVGFKDAKYFRKCFKGQYELSPTEYRRSILN